MRFLLFLLFYGVAFSCIAQQTRFELRGTLLVNGGNALPYIISVIEQNGTLSGYTLTGEQGQETKAMATGHINHKKHTLELQETSIVYSHAIGLPLLLVYASMNYTTAVHAAVFTGTFKAVDSTGKTKANGSINMFSMSDLEQWENPALSKPTAVPVQEKVDKPVKQAIATTDDNVKQEITKGTAGTYNWYSDTVIMEVWDGGIIDGDVITILYNNIPVLNHFTLTSDKKTLYLPHSAQEMDTITIIAEDEGNEPPNTADIFLTDGKIKHRVLAYNDKGQHALIRIKRMKQ